MARAATNNIIVERGTDYSFALTVADSGGTPIDLSGGTAADFAAHVRRASGKPLVAEFATSFSTDGTDGIVVFTLTDTETLKLNSNHNYVYDLFWTKTSGIVDRLVEGTVTVNGNITVL